MLGLFVKELAIAWSDINNSVDVNLGYSKLLSVIKNLLDMHCPVEKQVTRNKASDKAWITKGLKKACRRKKQIVSKVYP